MDKIEKSDIDTGIAHWMNNYTVLNNSKELIKESFCWNTLDLSLVLFCLICDLNEDSRSLVLFYECHKNREGCIVQVLAYRIRIKKDDRNVS